MSLTEHPRPLLASFYVKLLKHEGLWNDAHLDPCFSSLEGEVLRALSQAQRFSALSQLPIPDALLDKLYALVIQPQ